MSTSKSLLNDVLGWRLAKSSAKCDKKSICAHFCKVGEVSEGYCLANVAMDVSPHVLHADFIEERMVAR